MGLRAVVIDSREPPEFATLDYGCPSSVAALDAGDLLALTDDGAMLLIERKTPGDLLSSIQDGRAILQASRMAAATPQAYMVVTGPMTGDSRQRTWFDGRATGWNWTSVQGLLLTVQELGVKVLQLGDPADYPKAVRRLAERDRSTLRLHPVRASAAVPAQEAALLSLPGIGEAHAKALLTHCHTAAWSLAYLTSEDAPASAVPGIGPALRARVRQAIGLNVGEELAIIVSESGQKALEADAVLAVAS